MHSIRKRLSCLATLWVVVQCAVIIGAPAVLPATAAGADAACDCPAPAPGAECPMHHQPGSHHGGPSDDTSRCSMRSALVPSSAMLMASLTTGILPPSQTPQPLADLHEIVMVADSIFPSRSELPDAPPPRS
jgi:hypothetical protein